STGRTTPRRWRTGTGGTERARPTTSPPRTSGGPSGGSPADRPTHRPHRGAPVRGGGRLLPIGPGRPRVRRVSRAALRGRVVGQGAAVLEGEDGEHHVRGR